MAACTVVPVVHPGYFGSAGVDNLLATPQLLAVKKKKKTFIRLTEPIQKRKDTCFCRFLYAFTVVSHFLRKRKYFSFFLGAHVVFLPDALV